MNSLPLFYGLFGYVLFYKIRSSVYSTSYCLKVHLSGKKGEERRGKGGQARARRVRNEAREMEERRGGKGKMWHT